MRFISVITVLVLALLGLQSQDKPNILWITLEDTSPQFIGAYGNKQVKTPNIDKLAKEGVMFNNAFSNGTVCSPSRSTIITGCLTMVTGTGNHRSNYSIPKEICGFPKYMRDAGYYTTNNKKTDYNTKNAKYIIKQSWHESSGKAGWWNRDEGQPYFSVFNHNDCHQSRTMTNPYAWYKEKILSQLNEDELTSPEFIEMPPFYRDSPEMRKHFVRVYNSLNATDKQVGELLQKLEDDGLKENTIIFCYADHGEGIPRGKCNPIGFGYRVPFIVWFPEKYKHLSPWEIGKPSEELVCFEDLAPTMLSLAGAEIPSYMKGRPFLGEKRENPRKYILGSRDRIDESPDLARSITNGQYVYTRVFMPFYPEQKLQKYADVSDIVTLMRQDNKDGNLNEIQAQLFNQRSTEYLYDLKSDSWEIDNLVDNKKFEKIKKELKEELYNQLVQKRDILFMPEAELYRIALKDTMFQVRQNDNLYPAKKVIDAAYLVESDQKLITRQMELLVHENALVRYWGAIGLTAQKKYTDKHYIRIKEQFDNEKVDYVKIALAGICYSREKLSSAKEYLEQSSLSDELFIALQALQTIQYLPIDKIVDFKDVLTQVVQKYEENTNGDRYNVHCCAEVTLHLITNQPLYYKYHEKWLNVKK